MGIPSYYKKLADKTKGLVSKSFPSNPSALFFDFNCLIYHVARRPNSKLPPYPGDDECSNWEALLLDDIVKYIVKVWQSVGSPKEVFLAVDGVVPMAKIKQQRLRRFKSVWLAAQEDNKVGWDTNCITPGTAFMKKLTLKLQDLCKKHNQAYWSVSGPEEPGEGEHKIMHKLRQRAQDDKPILIYGLDADLILLTMLNAKSPAYLVREDSALGMVQLNTFGEEEYSFFSIGVLKQTLPPQVPIETYVAAMTLLGNDFLPHSLTVKIKDEGHTLLVKTLETLTLPLVTDGKIQLDALYNIIQSWASQEDQRMLHTLKKKVQMRGHLQESLDTKPVFWLVEQPLISKNSQGWVLDSQWRNVYHRDWLQSDNLDSVCREYVFGIQWVFDYYTGRPVDMQWCFSRLVPPLWSDVENYLRKGIYSEIPPSNVPPIQPHEQLAMVLPLQSWHIQQDSSLRVLPSLLPQFWPKSFGFFSAGRIRMWECEPLLPVLTVERLRYALKDHRESAKPK